MIHIGNTATPLPRLIEMLRPGDIVTHMYAPENGILDASGRVLPQVRAARQRGVLFDFGNGLNEHWSWDVAQRGLDQGFAPDTISSDLNVPGRTAQVFDLPNVLSKFLLLGMPLDEVIARVTSRAAKVFTALNDVRDAARGRDGRCHGARADRRVVRVPRQLQGNAAGRPPARHARRGVRRQARRIGAACTPGAGRESVARRRPTTTTIRRSHGLVSGFVVADSAFGRARVHREHGDPHGARLSLDGLEAVPERRRRARRVAAVQSAAGRLRRARCRRA